MFTNVSPESDSQRDVMVGGDNYNSVHTTGSKHD